MNQSEQGPSPELIVTSAAPALPSATLSDFESACRLCHACLQHVATEAGLPARTELVIADDFRVEVLARMRPRTGESREFDPDRPFGRVAAKNLSQDENHSHVIIVFDSKHWARVQGGSGAERLSEMNLIAHELAHTVLERIRKASGTEDAVIYPSITPGEFARSLSRIVMDEYFADRIADIIVSHVFSKNTAAGQSSPAVLWDISGEDYIGRLHDLFENAYMALPAEVDAYRTYRIPLEEMWRRVVKATEHLLTMYAHTRAHADAAGNIPILDAPGIKELPFVRLYLADTLPAMLSEFRDTPSILPPKKWREREERVTRSGETAIRGIWRRLGLTFEETAARDKYTIHVAAPLR